MFKKLYDLSVSAVACAAAGTIKSGRYVDQTVVPAIGAGIENTVAYADKACKSLVEAEVRLLKKYPNFVMLVNQSSVFRMAAADHYRGMGSNQTAVDSTVVNQ